MKVIRLEDPKGGLADYNRAIQLNPNNSSLLYFRGITKIDLLHDTAGGMADLDRAIKLDPNDALAHRARASRKYHLLKDRAGAIAELKQANKLYQQQGNAKDTEDTAKLLKYWEQADKTSGS